jgi:hypothetical protein
MDSLSTIVIFRPYYWWKPQITNYKLQIAAIVYGPKNGNQYLTYSYQKAIVGKEARDTP